MEGDEVGDMNHSCKFPPMIVDILHQEVSAKLGLALKKKVDMFNIPFFITADKDQSKFRKRLITAVRFPSLDNDLGLPFIVNAYLGHPAVSSSTGYSLGEQLRQLLKEFGMDEECQYAQLMGGCFDGEFLHKKVMEKTITPADQMSAIWDGAHALELVLRHSLADFPSVDNSIKKVQQINNFLRGNKQYEMLLSYCEQRSIKLLTPKLMKDLKFASHSATLIDNFLAMKECYEEVLRICIGSPDIDSAIPQGLLNNMLDRRFLADVHFLRGLVNLLTPFSIQFQQSQALPNSYVNTVDLLKYVFGKIDLADPMLENGMLPSNLVPWFKGYIEYLKGDTFFIPRTYNTRLSQRAVNSCVAASIIEEHQSLLSAIGNNADVYWYNRMSYWDPLSIETLKSVGYMLNDLQKAIEVPFINLLGCTDGASTLKAGFRENLAVDLAALSRLSFLPSQVTPSTYETFKTQLIKSKYEVIARGITPTLENNFKCVFTTELRDVVPQGQLHAQLIAIAMATSEAYCESVWSVMENYHNTRYFSNSDSDDGRLQREMFLKFNLPDIPRCKPLLERTVRKLLSGVTFNGTNRKVRFCSDAYLNGLKSQSKVIAMQVSSKDRKACLEF